MTVDRLHEIQEKLRAAAKQTVLASHKKLIPGVTRAYGVPMPVLNELAKEYKTGGFELVEALWQAGTTEERILAAKLMGDIAQKDAGKCLALVERFSAEISDWAVCDTLGMQAVKPLVKKHATAIFALAVKLNVSQNFWQRRLSMVLVE